MKKYLRIIAIILLITTLSIYLLLGSETGRSSFILPIINKKISHLVKDHEIVVTSVKPGLSTLSIDAVVDGEIGVRVTGPVDWLSQRFDLVYRVDAEKIPYDGEMLPVTLAIKGYLRGDPDKIDVGGKGEMIDASVVFKFGVEKGVVKGVRAKVDGADIKRLLALSRFPHYADGKLYLYVKIPEIGSDIPKGRLKCIVKKGILKSETLRRDYGFDLYRDTPFGLMADMGAKGKHYEGKARFSSSLADVTLGSITADSNLNRFKSSYTLYLPNMKNLQKISGGLPLRGSFTLSGGVYYGKGDGRIQVSGSSTSLGGNLRFVYDSDRLKMVMKKCRVEKIERIFSIPEVATGSVDLSVLLESVEKMRGRFATSCRARVSSRSMKRIYGVDIGRDMPIEAGLKGVTDGSIVKSNAVVGLAGSSLKLESFTYSFDAGVLQGDYSLKVPNLSRFSSLAGIPLSDRFDAKGRITYFVPKDYIQFEANSGSFGGKTRLGYQGKSLTFEMRGADPDAIVKKVSMEPIFNNGRVDVVVSMSDIDSKRGKFKMHLKGKADKRALKKMYDIDLGRDVGLNFTTSGMMDIASLQAKAVLDSGLGKVSLDRVSYRLADGYMTTPYNIHIEDLRKLESIVGGKYYGKLDLTGKMELRKGKLFLDGHAREWGGQVDYRYESGLIKGEAAGLEFASLLKTIGYPPLVRATANSRLKYSISSGKGEMKASLTHAQFLDGRFTKIADMLLGYRLSGVLFDKSELVSYIEPKRVKFDFKAISPKLKIYCKEAIVDRASDTIDAVVTIDNLGKIYKVRLTGPVSSPKMVPQYSETLKNDIVKGAEKLIGKEGMGGDGSIVPPDISNPLY